MCVPRGRTDVDHDLVGDGRPLVHQDVFDDGADGCLHALMIQCRGQRTLPITEAEVDFLHRFVVQFIVLKPVYGSVSGV